MPRRQQPFDIGNLQDLIVFISVLMCLQRVVTCVLPMVVANLPAEGMRGVYVMQNPGSIMKLKNESLPEEKKTLLDTRDFVRELMLHLARDGEKEAMRLMDELAVLKQVEVSLTGALFEPTVGED
jgi:hypothetical protein